MLGRRSEMAANVPIARRYARALINVASESHKVDRCGEQLHQMARVIFGHEALRDVMINPAYSRSQRMAVVEPLIHALGGVEPEVGNFVRLLVDRNRMSLLPDMARVYSDLADARAGRIRGRVISAVPLLPEALRRIGEILEAITQRKVVLDTRIDPSILGGVSAQVGSVLYDGTLRTQLEELRRTLRG
ncbi:MAG TPA: ATP synthase F1 subunit delta [Myxococcaceae bacterium]|nr:ATP synthase F1 subunit delta [Myxococcaceae bacterium]